MTSTSKNTAKTAVNATEAEEKAEATVPSQQKTGEKVTILKGHGGENGEKDAIIISEMNGMDEDEVDNSVKSKFLSVIRNKKVLAGLGTVAAIAIFAIAKGMMSEDDVTITTETDEDGEVTSVTVTNNDSTE